MRMSRQLETRQGQTLGVRPFQRFGGNAVLVRVHIRKQTQPSAAAEEVRAAPEAVAGVAAFGVPDGEVNDNGVAGLGINRQLARQRLVMPFGRRQGLSSVRTGSNPRRADLFLHPSLLPKCFGRQSKSITRQPGIVKLSSQVTTGN